MKTANVLLTALAVLAAGAGYYFLSREDNPQPAVVPAAEASAKAPQNELRYPPNSPQLAYLQIQEVLALPEPLLDPLNARVAYDEDRTSRVSAAIAGRVVKLGVRQGDPVRAGQPLAWLDAPDYSGALSDFHKAESELQQKQRAFDRAKSLLEGEVLARKEYEAALADVQQARTELARTRARLVNLTQGGETDESGHYVLRAPISGVVTERRTNVGNEVRPDLPDALFVITDPKHVWVVIDLAERFLGKISVGQRVQVDVDAYPGGDFTGRIAAIGEVLDPATRRVQVRCTVANPLLRLKPEMYARVTPIADEAHKLPRVSNSALITVGLQNFIFVEKQPGVFERRRIVLGLQGREDSYVRQGLAEGERVVVQGALLLNSELGSKD